MNHSISDALRDAIVRDKRTHYAIAKAAGIRPQMLDYSVAGRRSLRLETIDKLAPVLEVELRRAR